MAYTKAAAAYWIVCALAAYVGLFFGLHALTGLGLPVLAVLPVAAVAFFLGLRPGLLAALLSMPLNLGMFALIGSGWLDMLLNVQFITGGMGIVLVGGLLGCMRDLGRDLQQQRDNLHSLVQQRTASLRESHERLKLREQELSAANMQLRAHEHQLVAVNEQLRAQELELREANEHLENILSTKADGLIVMDQGLIIKVNQALLSMLGYSEQELLQMSGLELSYPEDRELASVPIMELLDGKRETFRMESRFVRKDGQVVWVRQTISAVHGSEGKPLYLVIMVEDIDESKKAALALQESEARFRAMFDSAAIGIGMMDLKRRVIRGNLQARGLLGYSEDELRDLDVLTNTHPDDRALDSAMYAELVSGKRDSYQVEKRYRHKDGHWARARSTLSTVKDADGHPLYILALVEDISDPIPQARGG